MKKEDINRLHNIVNFVQKNHEIILLPDEKNQVWEEGAKLFGWSCLYTGDTKEDWNLLMRVKSDTLALLKGIFKAQTHGYLIRYTSHYSMWCFEMVKGMDKCHKSSYLPNHINDTSTCYLFHTRENKVYFEIEYQSICGCIFDLFEGLPFGRFKTCPECCQFFIQKTGKERKYCCDYCKNKFNTK